MKFCTYKPDINFKPNHFHFLRCLVILCVAIVAFVTAGAKEYDSAEAIKVLDNTILNRDIYYNKRAQRIDSIKQDFYSRQMSQKEHLLGLERIGDEYIYMNNDSALGYFSRGLKESTQLCNDSMIDVFKLKVAANLPFQGFMAEAHQYFSEVDTTGRSREMKNLYAASGRKMYFFSMLMCESKPKLVKHYREKLIACQNAMLENLDTESDLYKKTLAEHYFVTRQNVKAWNEFDALLNEKDIDPYLYAIVAENMARIAAERGDVEAQKYYYALSANAGITVATRDISALQSLARLLYDEGDVARSYQYMSVALDNAINSRSIVRITQMSPYLKLINETHSRLIMGWSRTYIVIISILGICIIGIIVIAYSLYRQYQRRLAMHNELARIGNIKDIYLSQFMLMCSVYVDKLNQFNTLVKRKIDSGQTNELYQLVKSGKLLEEQTREFYEAFDQTVLHIYPHFVEDVNKLLLPDAQIVLKDGEKLNTDLRILAFIRFGIDDANHIAQILNYSVNTIYAYRNRMRTRAINRETFETDIKNL